MTTLTTREGNTLYYKDWGSGQPVVFSHGWPLSADSWESQMLHFAGAITSQGLIDSFWMQGMMGVSSPEIGLNLFHPDALKQRERGDRVKLVWAS